eukprot:CAMPEP_0176082976 /NCGR_PEP_ID=MMETSP0120_2-20121206/41508_1 /TAXON_ID=160619 /ORGANISM="Kryptoperidinium foliaceum, Strain CCMP 1326" /LENGTH=202 /DNA_ID=CAMNT_0017416749 /DNA_START=165 /DNA_END=770 /DNA_ORIENTATION=+
MQEALPELTPRTTSSKQAVARMLKLCSREPQATRLPPIRHASPRVPSPTAAVSAAAAAAAAALTTEPWQGAYGTSSAWFLAHGSPSGTVLREIARDDYRLGMESAEEAERVNALRRREQGLRAGKAFRMHARRWEEMRRRRQQEQQQSAAPESGAMVERQAAEETAKEEATAVEGGTDDVLSDRGGEPAMAEAVEAALSSAE